MTGAAFRTLYRMMPDRADVTYLQQTAPGVYAATIPTDCWWRPGGGQVEGEPSDGVYVRHNRTWFLPKATFLATVPRLGDVIQNTVTDIDPILYAWTVLSVNDVGGLGAWACESVSLELQLGLQLSATIYRPNLTQDSSYRQVLSRYAVVQGSIPAAVQTEDASVVDVFDRRSLPSKATAYLGFYVAVQSKDQFFDGVNYWTILASRKPNQLASLYALDLELIP